MSGKVLLILSCACALQLRASPQVDQITPKALVSGTNTTLKFSGSGLKEITDLWTSFGCTAQKLTNSDELAFQVDCPASACGIGALQVAGPDGISNYELILIDSLPAQTGSPNHHTLSNAQTIVPPIAIDSVLKQDSVDYYKFHGKSRQTFSIEAVAHRLGSQMDPVIRVLDQSGKELQFCDDEGGTSRDSRFQFTCPRDADYILAIHDVGYGGGAAFDYRLRFGEFPLIWFTYPLEPIENVTPELFGMGTLDPEQFEYCEGKPTEGLLEQEPNNSIAQAQVFSIPAVLNGKLQYSGDVDFFKFHVEKNQKSVFHGATRSLGSPADLVLRITKEDGKVIKEGDVSGASEGSLTNRFEEGGNYYLQVRELSGAAGPNLPYEIEAREALPGFSLSCDTDKIELAGDGESKIKITCLRFDYDGPITLKLVGAPPEIKLQDNEIAEKKNEIELKFKASDRAEPRSFGHFKIIGSAKTTAGTFTNEVSTAAALKKAFPLILYPNKLLNGLFSFAVKEN